MNWRRVVLSVGFAVLATVLGSSRPLGLGAVFLWPGRVAGELLGISRGPSRPPWLAVWLTVYAQLFALALSWETIRVLWNQLRRPAGSTTPTGYDPETKSSIRVLGKCGFQIHGEGRVASGTDIGDDVEEVIFKLDVGRS